MTLLGTLGQEPMLARAQAASHSKEGISEIVHEIGPGNFAFATAFLDHAQELGKKPHYVCHDFSDSSFILHKQDIEPYDIDFQRNSLSEFPAKVTEDPLEVVVVELFDDTFTDFFTMHEGKPYNLTVTLAMKEGDFPSKGKVGKRRLNMGKFTKETDLLLSNEGARDYTSSQIMSYFSDPNQWEKLNDVYPSFLASLVVAEKQFVQEDLQPYFFRTYWQRASGPFKEFASPILQLYQSQLAEIDGMDPADPVAVSIPLEAIDFLWNIRQKKKVKVDIFDYGFDSLEKPLEAYSIFAGQISSPVNFKLLEYAAQQLGFDTVLEKDTKYIKEHTGEDVIRMQYVSGMLQGKIANKLIPDAMLQLLGDEVKELYPGMTIDRRNILNLTVRRDDYNELLSASISEGSVPKDFSVHESKYHLSIQKGT